MYMKIFPKDKVQVAKSTSENEIAKALRHLKSINLKQTSVRDWKKAYEKELKNICTMKPGTDVVMKELLSKKRGWPPLIGQNYFRMVTYMCVVIA